MGCPQTLFQLSPNPINNPAPLNQLTSSSLKCYQNVTLNHSVSAKLSISPCLSTSEHPCSITSLFLSIFLCVSVLRVAFVFASSATSSLTFAAATVTIATRRTYPSQSRRSAESAGIPASHLCRFSALLPQFRGALQRYL